MSERDRFTEHRMDHGTVRYFVSERGTTYTNYQCQRRLKSAMYSMMRWFSRSVRTRTEWNDADMRAADIRDLRWVLGDLAAYVESVQKELDRIEGVDRVAERVKALREVAGRTPEEAAMFLAKAAEIERRAAA